MAADLGWREVLEARCHREIERARVAMWLLEEVFDGDEEVTGEHSERGIELLDHAVRKRVALNLFDPFPEALRRIIEMMQNDVLEPEPPKLSNGLESWRVQCDVSDQWKGRVALEQPSYCPDIQRAVGRGVEDDYIDWLSADE
jgi:hypothetical protein